MADAKPTLLVTGAGGSLGGRVVELLLDAGAGPLIATTREPEKLARFASRGVDVRRADYSAPETLAPAFAGAARLLLISTDAIHAPGARLTQHRAAVKAAAAAGIRHIVYTSVPSPHPSSSSVIFDDHFWTEQAIIESGLEWTMLRNNIYFEIALMGLQRALASGRLFAAAGDGAVSYVAREDCARAAAAALANATGRVIYDVTGPAAVTRAELAATASRISGKPLSYVNLDPQQMRQGLLDAGLPPIIADAYVGFDVAASRGYHAIVTPAVEELTGRAPTSIDDFLAANRAGLVPAA
jgi:NAD(P)H dehydrogenase (quinone)